MTRAELSESIRQFSMKWANKGKEDECIKSENGGTRKYT